MSKANRFTLRERARQLRRDQTVAEKTLWARLRSRQLNGFKFRRQFVIGHFITDFCCCKQRLVVVEIDGGQHASKTATDETRSAFLRSRGYKVLRFWDNEVFENIDGVLEQIAQALNDAARNQNPHPFPSPSGRGL
ncbi:MAG: endonuclease domain-containing protein [Deltaproteobacteria bacterium]|nr:endonuclease domain-containing protein [Deltaproteobacteria bacterium]